MKLFDKLLFGCNMGFLAFLAFYLPATNTSPNTLCSVLMKRSDLPPRFLKDCSDVLSVCPRSDLIYLLLLSCVLILISSSRYLFPKRMY